jgi:hypothetical protein
MAHSTQMTTTSSSTLDLRNAQFAWGSIVIGALVVLVYSRVLAGLVVIWARNSDYSHGFLVPVFAAYLVWNKRKTLLQKEVAPTWTGIAVVALALIVLLFGSYGAAIFLSRVSLVILLAGWSCLSWDGSSSRNSALPSSSSSSPFPFPPLFSIR